MAATRTPQEMQALIDSAFFGPSKQYVRWDTGLHEVFEQAVEELGGPHAAKPAVIRERMGISLLTTAQVKSHLQKYRIRVVAEKGSEHATEAQARAAQQLLERQKRQGLEGSSVAPRPRAKVPIRGSRQATAAGGGGGGAAAAGSKRSAGGRSGGRRSVGGRKRRRTGSSTWSDEEDEFDAEISLSEGEDADPSLGASEGGSQGEGRSASTTTRRAGARAQAAAAAAAEQQKQRRQQQQHQQQQHQHEHQQQRQRQLQEQQNQQDALAHQLAQQLAQPPLSVSVQECDAVPLAELSRRLCAEGLQLDASTMQGLTSRQLGLAAAAAAAAAAAGGRQPSGGSGEQGSTALPPAAAAAAAMAAAAQLPPAPVPGPDAVLSAGSVLTSAGAVAALNRQVQLEQALLEQSMWVQKLAAEVQDLRQRQRLGLPPPAGEASAFATPFAAMAGAAFPGGLPEPADSQPSGGNLATCDSTLLRLLSTTLGQASSWKPGEGSDAVAAAVKDGDVTAAAAAAAAEAVASLQRGGGMASGLTAPKPLPRPPGSDAAAVQAAAAAAAQAAAQAAANPLLTCDSGLLRLLSRSLYDSIPQPPPGLSLPAARQGSGAIGLSLGPDVQAAIAQAAAAAAAAMGPAAAAAALGPAALGPAPPAAAHGIKSDPELRPPSAPAAMDTRPMCAGDRATGAARSPPVPTPFAAAGVQALGPGLAPPAPASALPMMSALSAMRPPPLPGAPHQTSLDAFNSSLLTLGLAGAGGAAGGLPFSTAEFLRLCSLPGAADLLPQPFELGGN